MILEKVFKWLEISLFFDKSDQHTTMFDSYNPKLTSTFLGKVEVGNNSNRYSVGNDLEFKLTKIDQKHQIYKQFVAYNCNGCSIAPLTDHVHNKMFQEVPIEQKYFRKTSTRIYIDRRDSKGCTGELEKL